MPNDLGDSPENARSREQLEAMQAAAAEGRCMFCQLDFGRNRPLNKQGEFDPDGRDWSLVWVWRNPFPQEHHTHHILIVPKRHIRNEEWDQITRGDAPGAGRLEVGGEVLQDPGWRLRLPLR